MITSPFGLLTFFILLILFLQKISSHPTFDKIFKILPVPFWCYILPMMATTVGWLPDQNPLYLFLSQQLLPVSLVLFLIGTDVKRLIRLGPLATSLMLAGSIGTFVGGLVSFGLYRQWLPEDAAGGIGALTASWIGGSSNLLAVKEALSVSDSLIGALVIVDALIAYSWMGLLMALSAFQSKWDSWVMIARGSPATHHSIRPSEADLIPTDSLAPRLLTKDLIGSGAMPARSSDGALPGRLRSIIQSTLPGIVLSILLSLGAQWLARFLPTLGGTFSSATWVILLVTTAALLLSFTPLSRWEEKGISRMGTFALLILLASIGARAHFEAVTQAPVFLALGITWIGIHGLILIGVGFLLKAPLGLMATASQANIGGPISAPMVGATYHPTLAGVGLLMAILGNVLGTYVGLLTAFILASFR